MNKIYILALVIAAVVCCSATDYHAYRVAEGHTEYPHNGEFTEYTYGDQTRSYAKGTYVNGKIDGIYTIYSPRRRVLLRCRYREGVLDGMYDSYNGETGKLKYSTTYTNGKRDPCFKEWNRVGALVRNRCDNTL